jgi:hypothetical protein
VDSGCTALAFVDYAFAVRNNLPLVKLSRKRPLYLADGSFSGWIEYATGATMEVGDHKEELTLFVTSLAQGNPVILGLPWLRKHNPWIDWESLQLEFIEHCHGRCLPYQIESQIAQQATANGNEEVRSYKCYHAMVEDGVDSDEEDNNTTNEGTVTAATTSATSEAAVRAVATSGRDGSMVTTGRSGAMAVTTSVTSEADVRAVTTSARDVGTVTTGRSSPTRSPRPIKITAGSRKPAPGPRRCHPLARPPPRGNVNWDDANLLGGPNFLAL